jgi:hypothetical protein
MWTPYARIVPVWEIEYEGHDFVAVKPSDNPNLLVYSIPTGIGNRVVDLPSTEHWGTFVRGLEYVGEALAEDFDPDDIETEEVMAIEDLLRWWIAQR